MLGYQTTLFVNWQAIKTCKVWPRASRITSPFKLKDRCPTFFYEAKLNDSLLQSCCSRSASFTNCQSKTSHNSVFDLFPGQSLSSGATIGSLNICVFNINSCAPECPSAKRKRIERENLASNRLLILYFKCWSSFCNKYLVSCMFWLQLNLNHSRKYNDSCSHAQSFVLLLRWANKTLGFWHLSKCQFRSVRVTKTRKGHIINILLTSLLDPYRKLRTSFFSSWP